MHSEKKVRRSLKFRWNNKWLCFVHLTRSLMGMEMNDDENGNDARSNKKNNLVFVHIIKMAAMITMIS